MTFTTSTVRVVAQTADRNDDSGVHLPIHRRTRQSMAGV